MKKASDNDSWSFSYLVAAVDGIHAGLPHSLEHEGVTGGDGEQGQQVDGQEAVDDEGFLEAGRGEHLTAVRLRTKPVSRLQALVHGYRDRQKQGAWRGRGEMTDSDHDVHNKIHFLQQDAGSKSMNRPCGQQLENTQLLFRIRVWFGGYFSIVALRRY